jgi:uncharacterized protein YbjT (DUF2867 family)
VNVVTGAFSYTGSYIARALLERGERVRTLSRAPARAGHPLAERVEPGRLQFEDRGALEEDLRGAHTLFNTYWIRAPRGRIGFDTAVANTRLLLSAAEAAGVRRVVQLSVTGAAEDAPLAYFRGKAQVDRAVRESALGHAIVRPTLVFGGGDVLISNIAWALRRFPLFLLPGRGDYPIQPVAVEDVALIALDAARAEQDLECDAAGPDTFSFAELVGLIRTAIDARTPVLRVPPPLALAAAFLVGRARRDTMLSREELDGLMAGLLSSREPPRGERRLADWLAEHAEGLGRRYVSERVRNWSLR